MAWDFVKASSEYLDTSTVPISGYPFSFSCWFYPTALDYSNLVTFGNSSDATNYALLIYRGGDSVGTRGIAAAVNDGTFNQAKTTASVDTANAWHHAAGVFSLSSSRHAYLDGGNKVSDSGTTVFPTGLDSTAIGVLGSPTPANYADARIAEVGIWDVSLNDAEIAALGKGFSPLLIRPQNLVFYAPLMGDTDPPVNWISGAAFTKNGTPTVADHCPAIYPTTSLVSPAEQLGVLFSTATLAIADSLNVHNFVVSGAENFSIPALTAIEALNAPTFTLTSPVAPNVINAYWRAVFDTSRNTINFMRL